MFNFLKPAQPKESYVSLDGKLVLVKPWPQGNKVFNQSWGNSGYDRHVIK